mgnify:CR=1 FL=1
MAKVKICGVKRYEDITYVNKCMPEYIGFVFAKSKRQVTLDQAKALSASLNSTINKVGVFVNETTYTIINIINECKLGIVQLHGDETPEYVRLLQSELKGISSKVEIWKALRVKNSETIDTISEYDADAYLLDSFVENSYGGAGKVFDWNLAALAGRNNRIILAGGLNSSNVRNAISIVRPFAVDVSSSVETDGCKDEEKVREFICAARSYE